MSFFSRLFGKAPSPTAAPRSVPARSTAADVTISRSIEAEREAAAVEELAYGDTLLSMAGDDHSSTQKLAQQRLAKMLDDGAIDIARIGAQLPNRIALLSIASFASDPRHTEQVCTLIRDEAFWVRLAIEGPSSRLRQLAAEQVDDPEQLRRLLKESRGKDKNVYKILRRKCDLLLSGEKEAAERQAHIVALCETIERHSFKPFDGAFVAALQHLDAQWKSLEREAPAELAPRVEVAIERAREVISNHLRTVGAEAARVTAIENADPLRVAVLEEMRDVLASLYAADASTVNPADQLQRWSDRWKATLRHKPAGASDTAAFDKLQGAIVRSGQLLTQFGSLHGQLDMIREATPEGEPNTNASLSARYGALRSTLAVTASLPDIQWPDTVAAAASAIADWDKQRADKEAAASAALRQVGALIGRTNRAINDGKSSQAAGIRRSLAEAVAALPSLPGHLSSQIEQLDKRLNELQDWKSYAVAPKRVDLIERMQALVGSDTDPVELAEQIKRLQEEWKSITRGSGEQSDADWQKFHEAAQEAYKPCRDYFAEQAQLREANLEKRKALVVQLNEFENSHDWANADWKEVARVLRIARQDWRIHNPTERAANKPVQQEFDALVKGMQDRLDAEYSNNIGRKQSLIDQVRRLLNESDTRKAIDDVKRLQQAWKTAGLVPHQEDQKLWEEFRQQCDAVYRRSQEEYAKFAGELDANKSQVLQLISQAEACSQLDGAELVAAAAQIRQLRADFDAIGELPRAESADLQRKFQRAIERYDEEMASLRRREEQQSWNNLFAASNEVRLLQLASQEGGAKTEAELDLMRQAVRSTIDGVQQWPKGGLQAIERKLAAPLTDDLAANEAALRNICIRAEILTDTPTPAADQPLRRQYQLQSLVKGIGQATASVPEQMQALVFDWVGTGPVATDVYYELLERFNLCWLTIGRRK